MKPPQIILTHAGSHSVGKKTRRIQLADARAKRLCQKGRVFNL